MSENHSYSKQAISVDCVVFGFDAESNSLKVALLRRKELEKTGRESVYKLPGSLIHNKEDLETAVSRVLLEMTGLSSLYMKQMAVFSNPNRIVGDELAWVNQLYGADAIRIMTITYYSLLKLSPSVMRHTQTKCVDWVDVNKVKYLVLDHKKILVEAIDVLTRSFLQEPVAFELLPRKFTIRQLKFLYTTILNIDIDDRNFRKKILASGYIIPTGEKENGVAYKPAEYFIFDRKRYDRERKKVKLNLINWQ